MSAQGAIVLELGDSQLLYAGPVARRYRIRNRGDVPIELMYRFPSVGGRVSQYLSDDRDIDLESSEVTVIRVDPAAPGLCRVEYEAVEPGDALLPGKTTLYPNSYSHVFIGQPLGPARRYRVWNRGPSAFKVVLRPGSADAAEYDLQVGSSVDVETVFGIALSAPVGRASGPAEFQNLG